MDKTTIVAICGKSAAGKDTAAQHLFYSEPIAHIITSDTTRPKRPNEINHKNYHFITENQFFSKRHKGDYLEWTEFRNWYYGTPKDEILEGMTNIGVFNFEGMIQLLQYYNQYNIQPILIKVPWFIRLKRSIKREHAFHWEYIRRLWTDFWDYKKYKKLLKQYPNLTVCKNIDHLVIF